MGVLNYTLKGHVKWKLQDQITGNLKMFVKGVYLQNPNVEDAMFPTEFNGAVNLADAFVYNGMNLFTDVTYLFEDSKMYTNYSVLALTNMQNAGIKCFAGDGQYALDYLETETSFDDTHIGFCLPDEPDMFKGVYPSWAPDPLQRTGYLLKIARPDKYIFCNFGKGAAFDWLGYNVEGDSKEADFEKWINPLDSYSVDLYPFTSPTLPDERRYVFAYGDYIQYARQYDQKKHVYGFIEGSQPFTDEEYQTAIDAGRNPLLKLTGDLVAPILWNQVCNGSTGYIIFAHNRSTSAVIPSGWGSSAKKYAVLYESEIIDALKAWNEAVEPYENAILEDRLTSVTCEVTSGDVECRFSAYQYNGEILIFAMAHGDENYPNSGAIDVDFTLAGRTGADTITVDAESRSLTATDGVFSDSFTAYEWHIYRMTV